MLRFLSFRRLLLSAAMSGLTFIHVPAYAAEQEHAQLPHYLQTVTDPLGRMGTTYEYDDTGRLIATVDAETPVATLEGPVGDELGRRVVERITALTGRARPCQTYLHRGPGES